MSEKIRLKDTPETRDIFRVSNRAAVECAFWPDWKRPREAAEYPITREQINAAIAASKPLTDEMTARAIEVSSAFNNVIEMACKLLVDTGTRFDTMSLEHQVGCGDPRTFVLVGTERVFEAWIEYDLDAPAMRINGRWLRVPAPE